jgi:hypothetical protein
MKKRFVILFVSSIALFLSFGFAIKTMKPMAETNLKQVLLTQLKTTHNQKDWFVPGNTSVDGLTADQAMWKDKSGNHSVAQLAHHLVFWNEQQLAKFKGVKPAAFSGNNEETFAGVDQKTWPEEVKKLDKVMTDLESIVEEATEAQLKEWAPTIANISTHNAYHIGQIIYVRRVQGAWDAEKGVK